MKEGKFINLFKTKYSYTKQILIILLSIILITLLALFIKAAIIKPNEKKEVKKDTIFEKQCSVYKSQGIDYTLEDFNKDKKAEDEIQKNGGGIKFENLSIANQKLYKKSDKLLKEIEEQTLIKTNIEEVKQSIIRQTQDKNKFIKEHLGYPDSKYPDSDYASAKGYIDDLIKSTYKDSNKEFKNMYENMSLEKQQATLRYSLFSEYQYKTGDPGPEYEEIMKNYLLLKHPQLDSINSILLSNKNNKELDGIGSNLQATIISGDKVYFVYLISRVPDNGIKEFKILDIEEK